MKIEKDTNGATRITEVYGNTYLQTNEGKQLAFCLRDNNVEMSVIGTNKWMTVNMEDGTVSTNGHISIFTKILNIICTPYNLYKKYINKNNQAILL